uniref:Planctomycete cytochrome C n=1 Tax=Candidatus Kentrum sp. LFY TaxID=2126342 RepID=A0A450WIL3_9GAMM|nr:MAG: Planctomycete cytochrome C [Candidatus Kentron sp. LFY]
MRWGIVRWRYWKNIEDLECAWTQFLIGPGAQLTCSPNKNYKDTIMKKVIKVLSLVGICAVSITGCGESSVSFQNDVRPILAKNCLECHQPGAKGFQESGLAVGDYESLMKGTKPAAGEQRGQVIVPGDSTSSTLIILIEGRADPSISMPHDREPLKEKDIAILKKWIDQGAKNN